MKSKLKSKIIIIFLIIFATIGGYNSLIYADEQKNLMSMICMKTVRVRILLPTKL